MSRRRNWSRTRSMVASISTRVAPTSLTCCSTRPRKMEVSPARLTRFSSSGAGTFTSSCGARRAAASWAASWARRTNGRTGGASLTCTSLGAMIASGRLGASSAAWIADSSASMRRRSSSTAACSPSKPDCASSSRLSGQGAPRCWASTRCCSRSWARSPRPPCPASRAPPLRVWRMRSSSSSAAPSRSPSQRPSTRSMSSSRSSASSRNISSISPPSACGAGAAAGVRATLGGTPSCSSGLARNCRIASTSGSPSGIERRW
ncbi:hypothetical protein D9M71_254160 [compost metagenome]